MARRPLLGCIADDFTGATDLANNLVRGGMRTVQIIGVPEDEGDDDARGGTDDADHDAVIEADADAIVVALKSRTIAPADAVAQSLAALAWLRARGVEQIYFKYCSTFDSTAEGNIGPVIDALLDALHGSSGSGFTIACPAFPENQRTIFKGHLFVGDVLLSDSGMRHHPLTPMTDANLVRVLAAQTRHEVGLVAHDVVARGESAIRDRIDQLAAEGVRIAIVDAISNDDLLAIGRAVKGMPLVTAGSGVAIGLPQNWPSLTAAIASGLRADAMPAARGLRAIVSGSCSQATNAQVARFKTDGGAAFAIDPLALAAGEDVAAAALTWSMRHLDRGPVLIHATAEPAVVERVQAELGVARAGAIVEDALATIASGLVERGVRQLVVAGGETSGAVVQALGVRRMTIGPQIDPGVPWTAVTSPHAPDETLHLALKSGNFGTDDFFMKAFARLSSTMSGST
jgi:uncharacterized protein YgbK (DUF1537 family)